MATRREALMFILGTMAGRNALAKAFSAGDTVVFKEDGQVELNGKVLVAEEMSDYSRGRRAIWQGETLRENTPEGFSANEFVFLPKDGFVFAVASSIGEKEPWDVKVRITTEEIISALQGW